MPFGKYAGFELSELPSDYLRWLYEQADLYGSLADAVDREFDRRFGAPKGEPEPSIVLVERLNLEPRLRSVCAKLIELGYRQLALKNHPDVGGSEGAMKAINLAVEVLRRAVGSAGE